MEFSRRGRIACDGTSGPADGTLTVAVHGHQIVVECVGARAKPAQVSRAPAHHHQPQAHRCARATPALCCSPSIVTRHSYVNWMSWAIMPIYHRQDLCVHLPTMYQQQIAYAKSRGSQASFEQITRKLFEQAVVAPAMAAPLRADGGLPGSSSGIQLAASSSMPSPRSVHRSPTSPVHLPYHA